MKHIALSALLLLSFCYTQHNQAAAYPNTPRQIKTDDFTTHGFNIKILDYTDMVISQEGPDCGPHSIKNCIVIFNAIAGVITHNERNKQLQSDTICNIGSIRECRRRIEVETGYIYPESLYKLTEMLSDAYNQSILGNKLTILDNLLHPHTFRTGMQQYQLAEVIECIRNGTPFLHAFVLGNMNAIEQDQISDGHWIACVMERKNDHGELTLHVANSIHGTETQILLSRRLIDHLNQLNPQDLRIGNIHHLSTELENIYRNQRYEGVLYHIRDILDEAVNKSILTDPLFIPYKEQLENILSALPSEIFDETHVKLKEILEFFLDEPFYSSGAWRELRASLYPAEPAVPIEPINKPDEEAKSEPDQSPFGLLHDPAAYGEILTLDDLPDMSDSDMQDAPALPDDLHANDATIAASLSDDHEEAINHEETDALLASLLAEDELEGHNPFSLF